LPASIRTLLGLQATRLQRASFEVDAKVLIDGVARSTLLSREADAEEQSAQRAEAPEKDGPLLDLSDEAHRAAVIAGLRESPLIWQAIITWRDELMKMAPRKMPADTCSQRASARVARR
jgi:hypothetical protein